MLDIEIVTAPTLTALDVVSVADMVRHLRLSPTMAASATWVGNITDAINEVFADLEGIGGKLNRCVLPCTLRRHFNGFPSRNGSIALPYPPLISVDSVSYVDGNGTNQTVDPSLYITNNTYIGEISRQDYWPEVTAGPRSMSVTYQAGYIDGKYPANLKRLIKILAAHNLENIEATINEQRQMAINRQTDYGVEWLMATLKITNSQDDWC